MIHDPKVLYSLRVTWKRLSRFAHFDRQNSANRDCRASDIGHFTEYVSGNLHINVSFAGGSVLRHAEQMTCVFAKPAQNTNRKSIWIQAPRDYWTPSVAPVKVQLWAIWHDMVYQPARAIGHYHSLSQRSATLGSHVEIYVAYGCVFYCREFPNNAAHRRSEPKAVHRQCIALGHCAVKTQRESKIDRYRVFEDFDKSYQYCNVLMIATWHGAYFLVPRIVIGSTQHPAFNAWTAKIQGRFLTVDDQCNDGSNTSIRNS